jgi:murein L,D-transpeptidase YcbB/YkuD
MCQKGLVIALAALLFILSSCSDTPEPPVTDIASSPEQLVEKTEDNIKRSIDYALANNGDIGDSIFIKHATIAQAIYDNINYSPVWSHKESWKPLGDSLFQFISSAKRYGLFPEDYHYSELDTLHKRFASDSLSRRDAALWSKADLMLTNAFFQMVSDIKLGRLPKDSISFRKDSVLSDSFYMVQWTAFHQSGMLAPIMDSLEPKLKVYQELKAAIPKFLDSADNRVLTVVPLPGKDTMAYKMALQQRLFEGGYLDSLPADSLKLANAVRMFQKEKGITVDGKAGAGTIKLLNLTDKEKFVRIAIALDRYKLLPPQMPARYIWVNLPSFHMKLLDNDTIKLLSKIICGKTITRTPLLTSAISEMITYPQWTVPNSIIVKEILPAAKKDPGYFAKKGFSLVDKDGNEVDPYTVEWSRYNKGIPYKVVQGSGDDNALGILKFNFNNKYAVYLHDTNQRYLFGQAVRSLSHGCVRVQEWEKLAYHILKYDNPDEKKLLVKEDSLRSWLVRKEKHSMPVRNRLPVFIRYITCESKDEGIVFYDDIYGEDKLIRERYFAGK